MTRIGIDYTAAFEQGAGIGRLVRELIAALAEQDQITDYCLFIAGAKSSDLPSLGDNFHWYPSSIQLRWFWRIWYRARLYLPIEAFIGRVSLYHSPDFVLPPHLPGTKTILTIHDLSFVRAPDAFPPALKSFLDQTVPWSVYRADHILADSEATQADLIEIYRVPERKVTVLLSGYQPRFQRVNDPAQHAIIRQKYNIPDGPYIFAIGTVQPRKNFGRLVAALHTLGDEFAHVQVVIAGGKGWLDSPLYQAIDDLNMRDRVHLIGFADDEDIPSLYSAASITAYPSLYEGFGFPILESMGCGTPVLSSNVSSMPEVAGDAALLIDPYDVQALADGLRRLLTDNALRDTLVQAGYEQIKRFSWAASAQQLRQIYAQVLDQ